MFEKCLPFVFAMGLVGCSSDSPAPGAAGDAGGTGGASSSQGHPDSAPSSSQHGEASVSTGDAASASPECKKYCTCMAQNCADKVFPGGCLSACAAQSSWDLPCRQNMCGLVPAQPMNDHCTHAFGTSECK